MTKDLGVYNFVDENGNVTSIKRKKRQKDIEYPEKPENNEWFVIGVSDEINGPNDGNIAMGIDEFSGTTLAIYAPVKKFT